MDGRARLTTFRPKQAPNLDQAFRRKLHLKPACSPLEASEIDLVIEFATRQQKFLGDHETVKSSYFTLEQRNIFIKSLHAIAAADGDSSEEEILEIQSIAEDYGFPPAGTA